MNATVTIPLSEIDTLRNDLAKAQQKVSELESTQKKIKIEIREAYTSFMPSPLRNDRQFLPYTSYKEHPHQYINMDEVIDPIRQEEKLKVEENTRKLEKEVRDLFDKIQRTKDEYQKEIKDLKEFHQKEVAKLKGEQVDKGKDETISEQSRIINNLNKENISLTEAINYLSIPWYIRLFKKHE